jgi:hypothetical protein
MRVRLTLPWMVGKGTACRLLRGPGYDSHFCHSLFFGPLAQPRLYKVSNTLLNGKMNGDREMKRTWRVLTMLMLLAGLLALAPANPVGAAAMVGTGTPGSCDDNALNAALAGGGLVTFNCGAAPYAIIVSEKTISADTQIDGGGLISLSGNDANRIFTVNSGITLTLNNITLINGNAASGDGGAFGGAIHSDGGTLTITESTFESNNAGGGNTGGFGGAIFIDNGTLTVSNSTFSNSNTGGTGLTGFGSGGFGGAINSEDSSVAISNSTFSSNNTGGTDSGGFGGAIFSNDGTLTITHSTLNGNNSDGGTSGFGGAIYGSGASPSPTISATIMSNNIAGTGANCTYLDSINSQGYNLTDDDSCNLTATGDIQNSVNINLSPLGNYGGPTQTMLPQTSSDAIDSSDCFEAQDQRGIARPQGPTCDRGSVEIRQSATYPLCASLYTGSVTSPPTGNCASGQIAIAVPAELSFCINAYTGQISYRFGQPCHPPSWTHTLPDDGDLLTCVNRYNGANRWVMNHNSCNAYEVANTVPAMP